MNSVFFVNIPLKFDIETPREITTLPTPIRDDTTFVDYDDTSFNNDYSYFDEDDNLTMNDDGETSCCFNCVSPCKLSVSKIFVENSLVPPFGDDDKEDESSVWSDCSTITMDSLKNVYLRSIPDLDHFDKCEEHVVKEPEISRLCVLVEQANMKAINGAPRLPQRRQSLFKGDASNSMETQRVVASAA